MMIDLSDITMHSGGIEGGRPFNENSRFENDVETSMGDLLRRDEQSCRLLWRALVNSIWTHSSGEKVSYSYRAAGDLIAAIRQQGDYLEWYCCIETRQAVSEGIKSILGQKGWTWESFPET